MDNKLTSKIAVGGLLAGAADHGLWRGDGHLVPEDHQRGTGRAVARRDSP